MDLDKITIRGLTRGEIKRLKAEEIELGKINNLDENIRESAMIKIFELACPEVLTASKEISDDLTPGEVNELYIMITQHTYMTRAQLKNLDSPHFLASEAGSGSAASAEKTVSSISGTAQESAKLNGSSRKGPFTNLTES